MPTADDLFTDYSAAFRAWGVNPLDKGMAKIALVKYLKWLDAFLADDQPGRAAIFTKNATARANGFDLSQADLLRAYRQAFGDDAQRITNTQGVAA